MGLIRRVALDQLGGWDEWCITEDAELSLRLLRAGWNGLHMDQTWGRGVMPLTFEALKGQRYRWCFGGIQILRMHWRSLLPGRVSRENHLGISQRWAYLAGAIQWYGDLLGLIFLLFLLAGAANLATGGGELFRKLTPFLVATVPVLVGLGLIRAVALLRRGTGATWRDAIGAFFIWQATSLVVARASVLGLFSRKAAFLRTPKTSERARWWEALWANRAESALALMGLAAIIGALTKATQLSGPLLAALLVFPTLGMAAAPFNSWAAQRAPCRNTFATGGGPNTAAAARPSPQVPRLAAWPPCAVSRSPRSPSCSLPATSQYTARICSGQPRDTLLTRSQADRAIRHQAGHPPCRAERPRDLVSPRRQLHRRPNRPVPHPHRRRLLPPPHRPRRPAPAARRRHVHRPGQDRHRHDHNCGQDHHPPCRSHRLRWSHRDSRRLRLCA
jgi:hypothetical protein